MVLSSKEYKRSCSETGDDREFGTFALQSSRMLRSMIMDSPTKKTPPSVWLMLKVFLPLVFLAAPASKIAAYSCVS
jgi:hypothetical protein